jgi:hypothetical protein
MLYRNRPINREVSPVRLNVSLKDREAAFLAALASGEPPTTAAKSSGSSVGHAANMLRRPHIAACIREMALSLARVVAWLDQKGL